MPVDKIIPIPIEDEMKKSYLDYAMSVIVSRALPDARDGLKPVHRRILYSMYEQGYTPDKAFRKSAATVGEVLKSYHPHGDSSVYDALVRMAQPFNLRYPLIDGHGNFGSVDGDPPAAMRYTEARLAKMALEVLNDLDKNTVDLRDNFDNTCKEPEVLPACLPNLLLNGSAGIAVGMATNIPPHNLGELIDAIECIIEDPTVPDERLLALVPAPDFPTGGLILGTEGARQAYLTGRGSVTIRARTEIEELKHNKHAIIVTEIPYQVNKTRLIEQIADLVKEKRVAGITDLRDESDRRGMRIMIELSAAARPQVVLNQLYKHTSLQQNFGVNNLALVGGVPRTLTLRQCLDAYLGHRQEVVRRRTEYDLEKARRRAHILEGLLKALDHLDEVIQTIRSSQTVEEARTRLMASFELSEEQASAILDMRLQRLTGLERNKLQAEYEQVIATIADLQRLLGDPQLILGLIRDELEELRKKYGDARRSEIIQGETGTFEEADLIPETTVVISISHAGYVKRMPTEAYRAQRRGGRGVAGQALREEDFLEHIGITSTHHNLMLITTRARAYRLKAYQVPEASRQAKGTALVNLLDIEPGEKVMAVFSIHSEDEDAHVFLATRMGYVKKTPLSDFDNIRAKGLIALTLEEGDELVGGRITSGNDEMVLITRKGMSIRFNEADVRPMGRAARGVRGIRLREGDEVVSMANLTAGSELLLATDNGFGKRTGIDEYRVQSRGGQGTKTFNVGEKRGDVVSARIINPGDELIVCTQEGLVIRLSADDVSTQGRLAQGVTLIRLNEGDKVTSMAVIPRDEEATGRSGDPGDGEAVPPSAEDDLTDALEETDDENPPEAGTTDAPVRGEDEG